MNQRRLKIQPFCKPIKENNRYKVRGSLFEQGRDELSNQQAVIRDSLHARDASIENQNLKIYGWLSYPTSKGKPHFCRLHSSLPRLSYKVSSTFFDVISWYIKKNLGSPPALQINRISGICIVTAILDSPTTTQACSTFLFLLLYYIRNSATCCASTIDVHYDKIIIIIIISEIIDILKKISSLFVVAVISVQSSV